jgi:hypothetical protein
MHCKLLLHFFYYVTMSLSRSIHFDRVANGNFWQSAISLGLTKTAFSSPASSPRSNATSLAADFVPVTPLGGVAAVDLGSGISQLYYQNPADGIIYAYGVQGGPFVTGSTFFPGVPLIPANQVLSGSPIIAVTMTIAGVQQVSNPPTFNFSRLAYLTNIRFTSSLFPPPWCLVSGSGWAPLVGSRGSTVQCASRIQDLSSSPELLCCCMYSTMLQRGLLELDLFQLMTPGRYRKRAIRVLGFGNRLYCRVKNVREVIYIHM